MYAHADGEGLLVSIVHMLDPVATLMNNSVQSIHEVSSKCELLSLFLLCWDCSRHVISGTQGTHFTQASSTVPHTVRIT